MKQSKQKAARPVGRPPVANKASKSLGQVRVTERQFESYKKAAQHDSKTLSFWVRETLDKAAKDFL